MAMPQQPTPHPSRQAGASLIEVLIAALILAIGMLGLGAMQAAALRNSQSALERSQAVMESYAILDMMRANSIAARAGQYNMPRTCSPLGGTGRADVERDAWIANLQASLGEAACARIACLNDRCEIEIEWDDSRGTGGEAVQVIQTVSRL
ncbi:type IV pilus modification protein PilV [Silanimonas sp.]|uniref:type IV pilus modification protein PilV n=1 Tax=Silanimonas sp. TaxID=1929290 RepID=UPI0025EF06D5|nr:type IV pilus modification protein PilV [Silanimonas sp.]